MSSTITKVYEVTVDEIDENPDDSGAEPLAQMEDQFEKVVGEYSASKGMCQLRVKSVEVQGD